MQAYPLELLDGAEALQQLAKLALAVDVDTIVGGILCDDHNLAYALCYECLSLGDECLHGYRLVAATNERYGAVAAHPVATLRNLEVGVV